MTPVLLPTILFSALLLLQPATAPTTAPAPTSDADRIAAAVMQSSGAEVWPRVTRIRFTFNVEREGKNVSSVKHDWDVRAGTDTVTWNDKTVTVRLNEREHEGDEKQAYARFINDTYWLLAPLKVMDAGVTRSLGQPQTIDGQTYQCLHLSFDAGVGLTPTDRYNLWVNPKTNLVEHWDYIPAKGEPRRFTWDEYRDFKGLKLAMIHRGPGATISFAQVEVTVE